MSEAVRFINQLPPEVQKEIISTLKTDTQKKVKELRELYIQKNAEEFENCAHYLKSAFSSINELTLRNLCENLQQAGNSNDFTGAEEKITSLENGLGKLLNALD